MWGMTSGLDIFSYGNFRSIWAKKGSNLLKDENKLEKGSKRKLTQEDPNNDKPNRRDILFKGKTML